MDDLINLITSILNKGWISSLIGILGIVIGIIYAKIPKEAKPVYTVKDLNLIGKDNALIPHEVSIYYGDTEIDRLNKTFIIFWNNGKKTIYGNKIVKDDRLKLVFHEGINILSAQVLSKTREVNKFTLEKDPSSNNEVYCDFDFLDPSDGVTIEVLYTGTKIYSENNNVNKIHKKTSKRMAFNKISGTIKEIPSGVKRMTPKFKILNTMYPLIVFFAGSLMTPFFLTTIEQGATIKKLLGALGIIVVISIVILLVRVYTFDMKPYPEILKVEGIDI